MDDLSFIEIAILGSLAFGLPLYVAWLGVRDAFKKRNLDNLVGTGFWMLSFTLVVTAFVIAVTWR